MRSTRPKSVKRGGEEITIYPPVYTKTLIEKRLWQLKTPKPRITQLDKLNCIVIDIRQDFPTIPIPENGQKELVDKAREILYHILTLCRKREILHISRPDVENLDFRLRLFDAEGNIIYATGMTHFILPILPFKSSNWNDICQDLVSGKIPEIYKVLLLDARGVVSQEPRRAVLDASTACEIFIENFCENASKSSPKVDPIVYSALKQSKKREGEVLFYFHEVLKYLFGHSLKEDGLPLYEKIDCLRLTNNSVKHEGKCQYKKGKRVTKVKYHEAFDFISAVDASIQYAKSLGR